MAKHFYDFCLCDIPLHGCDNNPIKHVLLLGRLPANVDWDGDSTVCRKHFDGMSRYMVAAQQPRTLPEAARNAIAIHSRQQPLNQQGNHTSDEGSNDVRSTAAVAASRPATNATPMGGNTQASTIHLPPSHPNAN